ncbi:uncharacterized protein LOC143231420 [Tachypleus tridentatus]|uniref:uncharacterized protein LOC143231420 n=1 Tax=Tachypleus tridentatus TaxID=6853 RepID=UPI003FD14990
MKISNILFVCFFSCVLLNVYIHITEAALLKKLLPLLLLGLGGHQKKIIPIPFPLPIALESVKYKSHPVPYPVPYHVPSYIPYPIYIKSHSYSYSSGYGGWD